MGDCRKPQHHPRHARTGGLEVTTPCRRCAISSLQEPEYRAIRPSGNSPASLASAFQAVRSLPFGVRMASRISALVMSASLLTMPVSSAAIIAFSRSSRAGSSSTFSRSRSLMRYAGSTAPVRPRFRRRREMRARLLPRKSVSARGRRRSNASSTAPGNVKPRAAPQATMPVRNAIDGPPLGTIQR